ncbi:MAG: hypothetical protein ABUL61_06625, partial [Oleiharenicola lentus]
MKDLLAALFVTAGLLLPGAGWAFAFRWPVPWLAAGVLSSLAIFTGVVGFSIAGIPVTIWSMFAWLGIVTLLGGWCWRRRRKPSGAGEGAAREWWLAVPAVPMLVVAVVRAGLHPLPGADNVFRWDH